MVWSSSASGGLDFIPSAVLKTRYPGSTGSAMQLNEFSDRTGAVESNRFRAIAASCRPTKGLQWTWR